MRKHLLSIASLLISACLILSACSTASNVDTDIDPSIAASYSEIPIQTQAPEVAETPSATDAQVPFSLDSIPEFSGQAYVEINNNIPYFTDDDYNLQPFEHYSELDALGRCGTAFACISTELMPTEERGSIGQVKPSGWHTVKYDCVDGKYLYNRCHLIGYQLTAENANTCNLITGTRYMKDELRDRIAEVDIRRAIRIGACNVYHMCAHNLVHEKNADILKGLYKSAAFTLRAVIFLKTGRFEKKTAALLKSLEGADLRVLQAGAELKEKDTLSEDELKRYSALLLGWASEWICRDTPATEN